MDLAKYGKEDYILIENGLEFMQNSKSEFFLREAIKLIKKEGFSEELEIMPFMVRPLKIDKDTRNVVDWEKTEGFSIWIKL